MATLLFAKESRAGSRCICGQNQAALFGRVNLSLRELLLTLKKLCLDEILIPFSIKKCKQNDTRCIKDPTFQAIWRKGPQMKLF